MRKLFLLGDSTCACKDGDKRPETGWGEMLQPLLADGWTVANHAVNGLSTRTCLSRGIFACVEAEAVAGDGAIIQFGHNDEKKDTARHTDPGSTFDDNLRRFVRETRERGGKPVLFNSVVRRSFAASKTAVEDDDKRDNSSKNLVEGDVLIDTHGEYVVSPVKVAKEMGVPFVDANKITHDLEQGLGVEGSKKLHMWFKPGEVASLPDGRQDNTHYNIYGAYRVAGLLADAVAEAVPELKAYVRHFDAVVAVDGSGTYIDAQKAVDEMPAGKPATILICDGEWKKPSVAKDKDITFVLRSGAKWVAE